MKKILRLVTTSVLTLTLVACGEASSSVSTSGTTTSSSVSSVSSAYANVTSVTLSAATATLTQVMGSLRAVTVTATLNANTNPDLALEWYVNGVKSAQTGRVFEYTPSAVGSNSIQARLGSIQSNTLNVVVGNASFAVTSAKFIDADTIEIVAPAGASVTLSSGELADSSNYSIKDGKYIIDLKKAVTQGTSINVTLTRADGSSVVQAVAYDTRTLALDTFTLGGVEVKAEADGSYKIVKPFDAGVLFEKTYALNLEQENILGTTPVTYRLDNTAPAGATLTNENSLVTALQTPSFKVNSTTPAGLYTHKVTLGNKVVEVKVQVVEAVKEINFLKSYAAGAATFEFGYTTVDDNSPNTTAERITANADGSYTVVKPFDTFGQTQYKFFLNFEAINFAKPEFLNNQFSVALVGPSKFSTVPSQLFTGIERSITNSDNQTLLNTVDLENFNGRTGFGATTSATALIAQQIDSGTPVGDYTFTITAGAGTNQLVKTLVVKIVAPTPTLNFHLGTFTSTHDSDTTSGDEVNLGLETRNHVVTTSTDTFVIEKPLIASRTYSLEWITTLMNYQSKLLTSDDFEESAIDSLLTNTDSKKLFNAATGIATSENYLAANLLVKQGVTSQVIKAKVTATATTIDIQVNAADAAVTTAGTAGSITLTPGANVTPVVSGQVYEITLGTVTTTANATLGTTDNFELVGATFVETGTANYAIEVSNYPDVIELGERDASSAPAQYRFVNVGLAVTGPSTLIESFPSTRASILLANNTNGLILFNQTGAAVSGDDAKSLFGASSLYIQDGNGDYNDAHDKFNDGLGLNRSKLAITSTTVAGIYTLRFTVDNLVKEIKIQINNAQPKVFVLSGTDLVDGNDADLLTDDVVTSGGPSKVDVNTGTAQGDIARNKWAFATSGSAYAKLQIYDQDGILPTAAGFVPSLNDKFVAAKDGVYTFEAPNTMTLRDILYARISVADIALGEYTYAISKEYPDGRLETYSDVVEVTALDDNQLAVFGNAPSKFTTNWIVNETSYKVGTYKYSFTLGSTTLAFQVVVTEKPTLNIDKLLFGTTQLSLFEGNYVVSKAALTSTASSVSAQFTLDGLTTANYYTVSASDFVKTSTGRSDSTSSIVISDLPVGEQTLLDVTSLNLGKLADATPVVGEYVEYTIKFFSKSGTTYTQVGEDLVINVVVNENAELFEPYIVVTSDGLITENNELGEILTLKLFGAEFDEELVIGNITVKNTSPAGLAVNSLVKVDPNTVQVRISANSSAVYATAEPTLTLVVDHDDDGTTDALESGLKLVNNVAPLAATVVLAKTSTTVLTIDFEEQVYYKNSSGTLVALADGNLTALIGAVTVVNDTDTTTLTEVLSSATPTGAQFSLSYVAADHTLTITMATAQDSADEVALTLLANKLFDVGGNAIATKTDVLTI
jgi:hypothetical protein